MNNVLLFAPTEHALQRAPGLITSAISAIPERHGCDILATSKVGFVGFQRKTLPDLSASVIDGRLAKELAQMTASTLLAHSFLVLEYDPAKTTTDGEPMEGTLSTSAIRSLIVKAHALGIGYLNTRDPADTLRAVRSTTSYLGRGTFERLPRPKAPRNSWGQRTSRAWAIHLLQSFEGIGPQTAAAIFDNLGLPLAWTTTAEDLKAIDGIGPLTADRLLKALAPPPST